MSKPLKYFLDLEILRKIEVCEMIGCSERTLYNYIKKGMPIHKIKGATPYFLASEIYNWIKNN